MTWAAAVTSSPVTCTSDWQTVAEVSLSDGAVAAHLQIVPAFQQYPTADVQYRILSSPDGVSWDAGAVAAGLVLNTLNGPLSQSLRGYAHLRVQVRLSESGDTGTSAQVISTVG